MDVKVHNNMDTNPDPIYEFEIQATPWTHAEKIFMALRNGLAEKIGIPYVVRANEEGYCAVYITHEGNLTLAAKEKR